MKTYLVGGAVRDHLLGREPRERDWLVTGVSGEELEARGFERVGRQFPVYLHPQTHEEYALPRGTASGAAALEDDLRRRDLTINAMAFDPDGELIDPCAGRDDLDRRILRHTPAFRDDPIRLLRLARFAARLQTEGFDIATETLQLAQQMVAEGDLDELVAERTFAEIERALQEDHPERFFEVLRECGALAVVLPEVDRLFGIPQPAEYHPEIDSGVHTMMVLQQACRLSPAPAVRFAALLHDVGKGLTPASEWPRHIGHEGRGAHLIEGIARRLCLPNSWRDLALAAARHHLNCHRARELRPTTIRKMLKSLDALRRPQLFDQFLLVCEADARGRSGLENRPYPQAGFLRGARDAAAIVDNRAAIKGRKGDEHVAIAIQRAQVRAIAEYCNSFREEP